MVTALLMGVAMEKGLPLSDAEIKAKALELGMVEREALKLTDLQEESAAPEISSPGEGDVASDGIGTEGADANGRDASSGANGSDESNGGAGADGQGESGASGGADGSGGPDDGGAANGQRGSGVSAGSGGSDGGSAVSGQGESGVSGGADGSGESGSVPGAERPAQTGSASDAEASRESDTAPEQNDSGNVGSGMQNGDGTQSGENGSSSAGEAVTVVIEFGVTSAHVSELLEEAGLVEDAVAFDAYLCNNGYSRKITAGVYEIQPGTSEEEIIEIITKNR